MNTANYTATDSYPLTTEGLDFIQKQILILEQTAAAYGNGNWILQGMTDNSGILSSGVVAIVANGTAEIVEYDGGDPTSTTKWSIQSTTTTTPNRTVKKLVADENGTITGLTRIDIKARLATINDQLTDNSSAISNINEAILDINAAIQNLVDYKTQHIVKGNGFVHARRLKIGQYEIVYVVIRGILSEDLASITLQETFRPLEDIGIALHDANFPGTTMLNTDGTFSDPRAFSQIEVISAGITFLK